MGTSELNYRTNKEKQIMGKHKNNYKSKNGRYYVLKGSNAVMIAYNWDQANECFRSTSALLNVKSHIALT